MNKMNAQIAKKLAALLVTLSAAVSVSPVFAQTAQTAPQSVSTQDAAPAMGKTRAQVYAELIQAKAAGLAPADNDDYPPAQQRSGAIASISRWPGGHRSRKPQLLDCKDNETPMRTEIAVWMPVPT